MPFQFFIAQLHKERKINDPGLAPHTFAFATLQTNHFLNEPSKKQDIEEKTYVQLSLLNKMLSEGLITQEEYDKIKKKILGL